MPFDGAPSAVVKARELIQSRMAAVFQAEGTPYSFNEVLSAAYMEQQKMAVSLLVRRSAPLLLTQGRLCSSTAMQRAASAREWRLCRWALQR